MLMFLTFIVGAAREERTSLGMPLSVCMWKRDETPGT